MMQCHMACGISVNNDMETRTKYNVHIPRPPDPYPRSQSDLAFISNCIDTKNAESRAEEFVHPVYLCYEQQML